MTDEGFMYPGDGVELRVLPYGDGGIDIVSIAKSPYCEIHVRMKQEYAEDFATRLMELIQATRVKDDKAE